MKKILFILLSFISVHVSAQFIKPNNSYGTIFNRGNFDSTLFIPTGCGTPTLRGIDLGKFAIYGDTCNNVFYVYTPQKGWQKLGDNVTRIDTVQTITGLENYAGKARSIFVSDTLRGGLFHYVSTAKADSGINFKSALGGYWRRNWDNLKVNVCWFGAKNDSVTDATAGIQAAIDFLDINKGGKGGVVYFPSGVYVVSHTIYLGNKVSLEGTWWSSIQLTNSANCNMFQNPLSGDIGYLTIKGLRFYGNNHNNTSGTAFAFLYNGSLTSDVHFDNCLITLFNGDGIYITNGWQYIIDHSIIELIGGASIRISPSGTTAQTDVRRVFISNSGIYKNQLDTVSAVIDINGNLKATGGKWLLGLYLSNNKIENTLSYQPTIRIKGASNVVISGNDIINYPLNSSNNISVISVDSSIIGSITGNVVAGWQEYGHITPDVNYPKYGIYLTDSSGNWTLSGNQYWHTSDTIHIDPSCYNISRPILTDSLRNNSGILEMRKNGVFVPQFTLPSGTGGTSGKVYSGYGLSNVNDSTLSVDSSKFATISTTNLKANISDTLNQVRTPYYKKWVLFGDSFSATTSRYYGRVDSILNMTGTVTQAVSGAMISAQSAKMDSILAATPTYFQNFNIASILIGVNDWSGATYPLGTRNDSAGQVSFAGYLKHMIQSILTSNPKIELFVMTPTETTTSHGFHGVNSLGWNLDDLAALEAEICSYYGVQCIDLHSMVDFNNQTISTLTDDGLHPNYEGSKVLARIIAHAFVNSNNKGNKSPFSYKNGNYGLESLIPQAKMDIPGGIVTSNTSLYHYKSVATYFNNTSSVTGTMKIMMPNSWSDNLLSIEINGFNISTFSSWKVVVSGNNHSSPAGWAFSSAKIIGAAPFSTVRLAYDSVNSKCVILLGTTSTTWSLPAAEISDVIVNEGVLTGWGTGWNISVISAETNIATTKTVTPKLSMYETAGGNILFNTTNDDGKGKIQVNGRITYSVDPLLDASDSLVHADKKYVDAQVATKFGGSAPNSYLPYVSATNTLSQSPLFTSSGNVFYGTTFALVGSQVENDGSFRARTQFTGMYFDDAFQTIRFFANGGNAFKYWSDGTLRYYAHPSVSASTLVIPDMSTVDSMVALLVPKTTTVNGHALSGNISVTYPDIAAGAIVNNTTATTQATSDSSTKLATTAFVKQISAADTSNLIVKSPLQITGGDSLSIKDSAMTVWSTKLKGLGQFLTDNTVTTNSTVNVLTIPANTLTQDGMTIKCRYAVSFDFNSGSYNIETQINSVDHNTYNFANSSNFLVIDLTAERISSTSIVFTITTIPAVNSPLTQYFPLTFSPSSAMTIGVTLVIPSGGSATIHAQNYYLYPPATP